MAISSPIRTMTVGEYAEAKASVEAFEADYADGVPPVPAGGMHGFLVSHITDLLQSRLREQNQQQLYYVLVGEVGIHFDKPYDADIAVFERKLFPAGLPTAFIRDAVPELIVEVVSTYDTVLEVEKKILAYSKAGVREFWFVKNELNVIDVYRQSSAVTRLGLDDLLSSVLGFTLRVEEILGR
jgi:Uma2 family endonuclease